MRILVLSDIHGNLDALEASLAAAGPYDVAVNLGDIVGYGASPNEVIERSREVGKYFVRGNHDRASSGLMDLKDFNPIAGLAALWTRDQLTPENLEWLRNLPQSDYVYLGVDLRGRGGTVPENARDLLQRCALSEHRACYRMAENMSGTTARANDTSPVHGLGGDH